MATEKRLKGIPYKCDNCVHSEACERTCSIFAYQFLSYMIHSKLCGVYKPKSDAVEVVHGRWENVKETEVYSPDHRCTFTHTAETCSVCKIRSGFVG